MADDGARPDDDQRVQGVFRLRVDMIQPGGKHAQAAQLSPMLVRHDVIGIVRARPFVLERAHGDAFECATRQDAIGAVGPACRLLEHPIEIVQRQRLFATVRAFEGGAFTDDDVVPA